MSRLKNTFFKFLKEEHAISMLEKGEIYLPNLYSFHDGENKDSKTIDSDEGRTKIIDHIRGFPPSTILKNPIEYVGQQKSIRMEVDIVGEPYFSDVWCYCVTGMLFSDSLKWAIDEKKTSCVMILDGEKFLACIRKALPDSDFSEWNLCLYSEETPTTHIRYKNEKIDATNVANATRNAYWGKNVRYKEQREVRFVGKPKDDDRPLEPYLLCSPSIKDTLMEVDISNIDPEILNGDRKGRVIYCFEEKDSSSPTIIEANKPFGNQLLISDGKYLMIADGNEGTKRCKIISIGDSCKYLCHNTEEGVTGALPTPLDSIKKIVVATEEN